SPGGSEQHLTRAAAAARTRTQRPGKHLAVHASEIGCQTGFSNPSTISSTTAATLGTHSSTNPGRLCPSRDATGQQSITQSEDWYDTIDLLRSLSRERSPARAHRSFPRKRESSLLSRSGSPLSRGRAE